MREVSERASEIRALPGLTDEKQMHGLRGMSINQISKKTGYSRRETEEAVEWLKMMNRIDLEEGRVTVSESKDR